MEGVLVSNTSTNVIVHTFHSLFFEISGDEHACDLSRRPSSDTTYILEAAMRNGI